MASVERGFFRIGSRVRKCEGTVTSALQKLGALSLCILARRNASVVASIVSGALCVTLQTLAGLIDELLDSLSLLLDVLLEGIGKLTLVVFLLVIELLLPLGPGLDLSDAHKH